MWMDLYCSICSGIELQRITGCNQFDLLDNNIGLFVGGCSPILGEPR
jgi:hypothetical protein